MCKENMKYARTCTGAVQAVREHMHLENQATEDALLIRKVQTETAVKI